MLWVKKIVTGCKTLNKVARPSIFIGTPSIFKQTDLYCKTIMTYGLHFDLTLFKLDFRRLPGRVFHKCGLIFPNSEW